MTTDSHDSMDSLLQRLVRTLGDDSADATSVLKEGDVVGRYRILGALGRGGMGFVYRATDESLHRDVAIKIMAARMSTQGGQGRLLQEARAAAALSHSNIVTVFDVGEQDGCVYLAMEFIEGETLREQIGRARWQESLPWLLDIASALACAHREGVVHRDIKPENVLLRSDGHIKVLDFGIARRLSGNPDSTERLTETGAIVGTPHYMSPEQIAGGQIDGRTDQFSWGVLAYEVLSGGVPWPGETNIVALRDAMRNPPAPLGDVPGVVDFVVRKTLAFASGERFASFDEIIRSLEPALRASRKTAHGNRRGFDARSAVLVTELFAHTLSEPNRDLEILLSAFVEELGDHARRYDGIAAVSGPAELRATFTEADTPEGNVEAAVRAALAMRLSAEQLKDTISRDFDVPLSLRAAIARSDSLEQAVEEARRLSPRQGVLVAASAHPYMSRSFQCGREGDCFRVEGLGRPQASEERRADLVGRRDEIEYLTGLVDNLRTGRGHIAAILGDPGVGKTRLLAELRERHSSGLRWLVGHSYEHTRSRSYAPLIGAIRGMFQLSSAEADIVARARLRAGLRSLLPGGDDQLSDALSYLLGIEQEGTLRPPPTAFGAQLVVAMRSLLEAFCRDQPTVLVFEDLHAADGATIELLTALAELPDKLPLLLVFTSHPTEQSVAWDLLFYAQRNFRHRYSDIHLGPLGESDAGALLDTLLASVSVPARLHAQILERSEGNPLFVEELVRSVVQEREDSAAVASTWSDGASAAVPATIRDILAARIERLPQSAREVLQQASVIGREFSLSLLSDLGLQTSLADSMAQLVRAELVDEKARIPDEVYKFRHALAREVSYQSLSREQQRQLHGRLAKLLSREGAGSERGAELARHFEGAEEWELALEHRLQAARSARSNPEAVTHYWKALELIDRIAEPRRETLRIQTILALLGQPGWLRDQAAKEEGLRHLRAAIVAAEERQMLAELARLQSLVGFLTRDEPQMRSALSDARVCGDASATADNAARLGDYLGSIGKYSEAVSFIDEAITLFGESGKRHGQAMTMVIGARCYSARSGSLENSLEYARRGRKVGEELGDARLKAWRAMEAEPLMYLGRWEEAIEIAEEALPIAWNVGARSPIMFGSAWLAIAYLQVGRDGDAASVLGRSTAEAEARGIRFPLVYLKIATAQLHLQRGELKDALAEASRAVELGEGYPLDHGAAFRVHAEVLLALDRDDEAIRSFERSLEILGDIQARPELGQTLLGLGRVRARRGDSTGHELLRRAEQIFADIGADWWRQRTREAMR